MHDVFQNKWSIYTQEPKHHSRWLYTLLHILRYIYHFSRFHMLIHISCELGHVNVYFAFARILVYKLHIFPTSPTKTLQHFVSRRTFYQEI
jgi:hypothetical protein